MTELRRLTACERLLTNETSQSTDKHKPLHFAKVFVVGSHIFWTYKAALRCMLCEHKWNPAINKVEEITYAEAYKEIMHRKPTQEHLDMNVDKRLSQLGDGPVYGYDIEKPEQLEKLGKIWGVRL